MTYQVNNVSKSFRDYKYIVIRDCEEDIKSFYNGDTTKRYWYYGAYNSLAHAQAACDATGNGFIAESEEVEPLNYSRGW